MARRPRTLADCVPLHVVQRGHNRKPCFFTVGDRLRYLHWLGLALAETQCQLHAYVLMTNHVHLLITPASAEHVPNLLMSLGRRYVRYVNQRYRRTGTLWDSRYKASLITTESYLLTCHRYVELNPVRAGIVEDPARYRWSSYRCNAMGEADPRITPHPVYLDLSPDPGRRLQNYRRLFEDAMRPDTLDEIRSALTRGASLGGPSGSST